MNNFYHYSDDSHFTSLITKWSKNFHFNNKKNILFIEPYGATLSMIKRGLERRWNIIVLTAHSDLRLIPKPILDSVQLTVVVETLNEEKVLKLTTLLHQVITFHAIIPGFEYFVPIAAKAGEKLHLPSLNSQQVMGLRRKDVMRVQLQQAKVNIPQFHIIHSVEEIENAISYLPYPFVCKPVDAAGSVLVKKVKDKAEAFTAIRRILDGNDVLWGYRLTNIALVEEYIEGKEYSLEGIVMNGKVIHFSITEKIVFDQSDFIEIGHIVNPPLSVAKKQLLENYVENVISILGANHCPFHAELRLGRDGYPILMEIAARLAGDKIGDLITLSRGINYFDYVYAAHMGETLPLPKTETQTVGIRFFYRPEVNCYSVISGLDDVKQYEIEDLHFYYQPNTPIPDFPKPLRRLGHVIIKTSQYPELCDHLLAVDKTISFS